MTVGESAVPGRCVPLMPGDRAPGARQAQTVLRTVYVRARSPGRASPSLLLYFAPHNDPSQRCNQCGFLGA